MATWVRSFSADLTGATDADLDGPADLDNDTAPGDFDPAAVNSVRFQYTVGHQDAGGNDQLDPNQVVEIETTGGTQLATVDVSAGNGGAGYNLVSNDAAIGDATVAIDETDNSPQTIYFTSNWESAQFNGVTGGTIAVFGSRKAADGNEGQILASSVTITIDYTPSGGGSTTLTGSLYTPTPVFNAGTVTAGSVTVTGSAAYTPTPVFNTGTITAGQTIVGAAAYAPTPTFATGTVTPGSVTVTGSLFTPTIVFGTGSVYEPTSTIYPGGLVAADFAALYDGRNLGTGDISSWTDESGNGRHITTITSVNEPSVTTSYFGGNKAALFDVSSQEALEYDEGSEFYTGDIGFITVFQFVSLSTTDDRVLFSASTGGSGTTWKHIGAHTYAPPGPAHQYVLMSGDGSPGAHLLFGTPETTKPHIMTQYIRDSGDDDAWIDKTQELDATNSGGNNLRGWRLGAREDSSRWLDGVIAYHCIIEMDGLTEADLLAARDEIGRWFGIEGFKGLHPPYPRRQLTTVRM